MPFPLVRLNSRVSSVLALALPLLLGACATAPGTQPPSVAGTEAERSYHDAIEMGGRLSVRYQRNGNEESLHGSFTWEQTPDRTLVTLLSPLGQTLALIDITPASATLMQPGQPPRIAQDVDTLTASTLGWPLPVSGLQHWLQGFASIAPGSKPQAVPAEAGIITTPDGWRLRYVSWQHDTEPFPRRLDLDRYTSQAGEVSLRIVIDRRQPQ